MQLLTETWRCGALPELPPGSTPFAELRVLVDARGRVAHVHVAAATNREVGDLAARCAIEQRYAPQRDARGRPLAAVLKVTVRLGR